MLRSSFVSSSLTLQLSEMCVPVWDFFKPDPSFDYPTVDGALSQGTLRLPTIGAFMSRPKGRLRDCYARKQAQASKPLKKREAIEQQQQEASQLQQWLDIPLGYLQ